MRAAILHNPNKGKNDARCCRQKTQGIECFVNVQPIPSFREKTAAPTPVIIPKVASAIPKMCKGKNIIFVLSKRR